MNPRFETARLAVPALLGALALAAGLIGCSAPASAADAAQTPPPSPTPWPTLAVIGPTAPPTTPEADHTPAQPEAGGPVLVEQYRAEVSAGITAVFPLEGRIEYPARIEVIVLAGDINPVIVINNMNGDRLAYSNSGAAGEPEVIGQFLFPGDGFYELGITTEEGSGEVGVSIYRLDAAQLEGGGTFSSMDEELRGTMNSPASFHTFRLPVVRGQRFDIAAQALTEGLDLLFELYGPDGRLLAARDDNVGLDPYLWNFRPSQDGIYTVVLSNYDEGVGDYVLRVSPAEGGEPVALGVRTDLELQGFPRRSTWLTFEGRALDAVYLEVRPLDSAVDVRVSLTDPYGNRLATANLGGAGQRETFTEVQLPFDGEYQLEFETLTESGTVQYYVTRSRQAELEQGGRIVAGGLGQSGLIRGPGTVVVYLFDAQMGDWIGVDAHATSSTGLDLAFDLFTPSGRLLIRRDDVVGRDPVIDRLELPESGTYALAIWNVGSTTGPFDVFVTRPETPSALPPDS